jgi:hypothetical protein
MAVALYGGRACGQITINEIVEDEQDFETTDVTDNREFIELYNAGNSAVDISNYTMHYYLLGTGASPVGSYFLSHDTIPSGTSLASHAYYVIGADSVPHVNLPLGSNIDLFPNANTIFELRTGPNTTDTLLDAVGIDTFRDPELHTATQEQVDQVAAGKTAGATLRGGWWGQVESDDAHPTDTINFPNLPMSIGRYKDGYDHNVNGRDFGMIPATPGTTNNLAQVTAHSVPNVDSLAINTNLRDDYYASFKLPRVVDPAVVGPAGPTGENINPNVITTSPQGGKAIIAWDETGGGNAVYSKKYANAFKLYAYIDPRPLNVTTANSNQSEATIYGIAGTTDVLFGTPNSAGLLTGQPGTGGNITSSSNGSTGIGWLIQRRTSNTAGTQSSAAVLQLIDFQNGGDGATSPSDWVVKQTIDISSLSAGWHILGVQYDPSTGNVVGTYDSQTFNFTSTTDLVGNFYVGYREQLPGTGDPVARPPTYDLFVAPPGIAGDFNNDGKVDAGDYATWRKNAANASLPNDNGLTTQAARYNLWRSSFGTPGAGSGSLGAGAVPEPSTVGLAVIGLFSVLAGCRRRAC